MTKRNLKVRNLELQRARSFRRKGVEEGVSKENSQKEHPKFSFEHTVWEGDYAPSSKWQKEEFVRVLDGIRDRCRMTWQQIAQSPRTGLGSEIIDRGSLNVPVPRNVPVEATIRAFRFSDKGRMTGYRVREVFYIIWLDRKHSVYDG